MDLSLTLSATHAYLANKSKKDLLGYSRLASM